jgi:hypothetical protein
MPRRFDPHGKFSRLLRRINTAFDLLSNSGPWSDETFQGASFMHSPSDTAARGAPPSQSAIWNPAAAACWSIIFTPAFGAYIVMRNWEALGDSRQATIARKWYCLSLGLLAVQLLSTAIDSRLNSESNLVPWVGLFYLLAWSLGAALPQVLAVRSRVGPAYERKPWDAALMAAVIAGIMYFAVRGLMTFLFVALT